MVEQGAGHELLRVIISLDVEEEGLFSGKYEQRNPTVRNVSFLRQLKPLSLEYNFPLTLLCSHAVFTDNNACRTLEEMRDETGAEIGAHLHHWNTPPLAGNALEESPPTRTHKLDPDILGERLKTLLEAGRNFQGAQLTSFRMGRWDLKAQILPILAEQGITVDSSICPLRSFREGADHFLAPADPWWHVMANGTKILEAPITQIPIFPTLARLWHKIWRKNPSFLDSFHFFGALSANPLWHSAIVMRQAVARHVARGGKVLNLFLHSSELMPGASPHVPNPEAARDIVNKLLSFCAHLKDNYPCAGITMNQLPGLATSLKLKTMEAETGRDW